MNTRLPSLLSIAALCLLAQATMAAPSEPATSEPGRTPPVAEGRTFGDKLAAAARWTRDEVKKGMHSLAQESHALAERVRQGSDAQR
jgi:hypothetical protein